MLLPIASHYLVIMNSSGQAPMMKSLVSVSSDEFTLGRLIETEHRDASFSLEVSSVRQVSSPSRPPEGRPTGQFSDATTDVARSISRSIHLPPPHQTVQLSSNRAVDSSQNSTPSSSTDGPICRRRRASQTSHSASETTPMRSSHLRLTNGRSTWNSEYQIIYPSTPQYTLQPIAPFTTRYVGESSLNEQSTGDVVALFDLDNEPWSPYNPSVPHRATLLAQYYASQVESPTE